MKRLIVCADGTWNNSDVGAGFTNVARLGWAIQPNDVREEPATPQIVYYHSGVGTGDLVDKIVGGGIGAGLARNVRDAYSFVASNYCEGDEVFLFGFSRGAYTARSIAGLIGWGGLLHKKDMDRFTVLWESFKLRGQSRPDWVDAREVFIDRHEAVTIRCVGVWDTVGALGIPGHLPTPFKKLYQFLDTSLGPRIQHAFHAIALDEHRSDFAPTLWFQPPEQVGSQHLEQTWFSGAHSNVGGGYDDHGLSDITLAWMASRIEALLAIDTDSLAAKQDRRLPWAMGTIVNSAHGIWPLLGTINRKPFATNSLGCTNEALHISVEVRVADPSAGYHSPSLAALPAAVSVASFADIEAELRWTELREPETSPKLHAFTLSMRD